MEGIAPKFNDPTFAIRGRRPTVDGTDHRFTQIGVNDLLFGGGPKTGVKIVKKPTIDRSHTDLDHIVNTRGCGRVDLTLFHARRKL